MRTVLRSAGANRLDHHLFMVAHEVDDRRARHRRFRDQCPNRLGAIGSAIDIIAQMDHRRLRDRTIREIGGNRRVQRLQLLQAAMHIADRVNALAFG